MGSLFIVHLQGGRNSPMSRQHRPDRAAVRFDQACLAKLPGKSLKGITQTAISSTLQLELEAVRLHSARRYAALPNGHFSVTRLRLTWPQLFGFVRSSS